MRASGAIAAVLAALLLTAGAALAVTTTQSRSTTFKGTTSDGFAISFRVVRTTTTIATPRKPHKPATRTTRITRSIAGVVVKVNSYCSKSGPRVFTARGGTGTLRDNGSFTARGGGVAVRGKVASGRVDGGTVSEFQRFGADVCRGAVFFSAVSVPAA